MGSYAQDRFGSGEDIKRGEWECEKRWLEMKQGEVDGRKRIEMEDNLIVGLGVSAKGKKSGKRSISPTSPVVSPENELALSSDSTVSAQPHHHHQLLLLLHSLYPTISTTSHDNRI